MLLLPTDAVPPRWQARTQTIALVHLLPQEAAQLLAGERVRPALDDVEERLLQLVAERASGREIARQLGVSLRTAQRRLATLRRRFGVSSTDELAALLSRPRSAVAHGVNGVAGPPPAQAKSPTAARSKETS